MPTNMSVRDALDDAQRVKFFPEEYAPNQTCVAWFGGTTFNVYALGDSGSGVREITCFNVSDAKGRPLSPDRAAEKMDEWIENTMDEGW